MRAVIVLVVLFAAVLEVSLLYSIAYHPAGGWGEPRNAWYRLIAYAATPLSLVLGAAIQDFRNPHAKSHTSVILAASSVGPASLWLALASYGHTMVLPMVLGYVFQLGFALVSLLPRASAT